MKRLWWQLIKKDQQGGVLILVALLLVVLLGMAALTVDVGGLYLGRRQAVNAADASALAASLENNENQARNLAREYAELSNDVRFEGIKFTYFGSGQSQSDTRIITVLVSKQVEFYFAPVLGFNESDVLAMASVQVGPGNGLVPIGMQAVACGCCEEADLNEYLDGYPEEFVHDCGCSPSECEDEEYECKVGCRGIVWKVHNNEGKCAKPGEEMIIKYSNWKDGEFGAGNFHPVRLPGQKGGNEFRTDLTAGYDGPLDSINCGTEIEPEPGNMVGPTGQALDRRLDMATDTHTYDSLKGTGNPYDHEMLVIIPLVEIISTGSGGGASVDLEIVGYASFLLLHEEGESGAEVTAILFEYLTFDEIVVIFDGLDAEGFVLRLVKDPPEARQELLNNYNNK